MKYELKPLPYDYSSLEPFIDAETVKIHHDKHQAAYVKNLDDALAKAPDFDAPKCLCELLKNLDAVPSEIRQAVKNNGGGVWNHEFYWDGLCAGKTEPSTELNFAINKAFGGVDSMKEKLLDASLKQFGSGWAWLIKDANGNLKISATANQDSPAMAKDGSVALFCIDVWEHAYYLKYRNLRADYAKGLLNLINWKVVSERFARE